MKFFLIVVLSALAVWAFEDVTYYNSVIGQTNDFRVFTPLSYNPADKTKRYPVIYFLHGCRGSHQYGDWSVSDYDGFGLTAPVVDPAHGDLPDYGIPYNADFESYADSADVIVVAGNGNFAGGGCGAWEAGFGGSINLAALFKVLIDTVDKRYNTLATPAGRAITGVSMGGYAATFIAGNLPDHFISASEFCRAPGPFVFDGRSGYSTHVDLNLFWRNFRRLPFRCLTNFGDYLQNYTVEMAQILKGASPGAEFQMTEVYTHCAGDIHAQFDFHKKFFDHAAIPGACVSYIGLYPDFDFNGITVHSNKNDSGYVYFRDVASNGFGVYTRKVLPFGVPFPSINLSLTATAGLKPSTAYTVARYHYAGDSITTADVSTDAAGKLALTVTSPKGQEIGIVGDTLLPPVFVLLDTFSENLCLPNGKDTAIGIDVVNLSGQPVTPTFTVTTENSDILALSNSTRMVTIPARSRFHIDSLVTVRATWAGVPANTGYLKIKQALNGVIQQRETLLPVLVMDTLSKLDTAGYQVLDGRGETFPFASPFEGTGNGNGVADSGEIVSVWIYPPEATGLFDTYDFRPALPCINQQQSDFSLAGVNVYENNGRIHYSVLMRVNRKFTEARPCIIPFESKCQWGSGMGTHGFARTYHLICFPKSVIGVEDAALPAEMESFTASPNPFNPSVTIRVNLARFPIASITLYDIHGRLVADLSGRLKGGKVVWNARDTRDMAVPGGVYFVRLKSGKQSRVKRIVYLP